MSIMIHPPVIIYVVSEMEECEPWWHDFGSRAASTEKIFSIFALHHVYRSNSSGVVFVLVYKL